MVPYNRFFSGVFNIWFVLVLSFSVQCQDQRDPIRVACIGNSITFGSGVENRPANCYPNQMQRLLGEKYEVQNFGVSGATLLNLGDKPYMKEQAYKESLQFKPEIVIIKLGTNDSKPQNWDEYKSYYVRDYKSLIASFRNSNPDVKVFVCLPVPAFGEAWGIRDKIIKEEILPLVKIIATEEKATLIDLYNPLINAGEMFPDKIHPNAKGAKKIAELVFEAIKGVKVR
jgi:acyl-CoA thioesterase-1